MSKIDELIEKLCPEGVEFRKLGDIVSTITTGKLNANAMVEKGKYPFFTCDAKPFTIDTYAFDAEAIIVSGNGSQVGHINFYKGKFNAYQRTYVISGCCVDLSIHYLLFYLKAYLRSYIFQYSKKGSVPYITMPMLQNFRIPIPPLEIQQEIVKILDAFTQLEAELEAELEARKIQYEYYRNHALTFDENKVPLSNLGDVYQFQYGKGNTIPTTGGNFPVYGSNGIVGSHDEFNSQDAPVIGHIGAYAGIVNWGAGKHFVTYNGVICKIKDGIDPRFGYHLLKKQNLRELAKDGSQPFVSYDKLNGVKVQIPNIRIQTEIAKLLDTFDTLVNNISEGLPAEITARRQQYEHYRNRLLTFQEAS